MQAVDRGASRDEATRPVDGDLPVRTVAEGDDAPFVERVYRHRTFFSRLHHFVRLSSAFIVTLEAMMVWQLLQAKHLPPTPFLLYGSHWRGLCSWLEEQAVEQGFVDPDDLRLPTLVDTVDEAVNIILENLKEFRVQKDGNGISPGV